jgi:hypothetical protein
LNKKEKETAEKFIFGVNCWGEICGNHSLTAPSAKTLPAMHIIKY